MSIANHTIPTARIEATIRGATRERRRRQVLLSIFGSMGLTGLVVAAIAWHRSGSVSPAMLGAFLAQIVSLAALIRLWTDNRRQQRRYDALTANTVDAIEEALINTQREIREHWLLVIGLAAVVMPVTAASVVNLVETGRMNTGNAVDFGFLFGSILLTVIALIVWRIYQRLQPQSRMLTQLQQQLLD